MLTKEQIIQLVTDFKSGKTTRYLSDNYGTSQSAIRRLLKRRGFTIPKRLISRESDGVLERFCSRCSVWRNTNDFYKNAATYSGFTSYCKQCVDKGKPKDYHKNARRKLRLEAIEAYGGQCSCCSESNWEFLTIDHIYGDGKEHRLRKKCVYAELRRLGWPKNKYRLLCYNCNCSIGALGYCPHQRLSSS